MVSHEDPQSPLLRALWTRLEAGESTALDDFWRHMREVGAPLVEPSADDNRDVLVTFLWRDTSGATNVDVIAGVGAGGGFAAQYPMRRLDTTDLWYRTDRTRADVRNTYALAPNNSPVAASMAEMMAHWRADPLNPRTVVYPKQESAPGEMDVVRSLVEGPDAPAQPWIMPHAGVPAGAVHHHRLPSAILENERDIWVYTPPDYTTTDERSRVLILFDGWEYLHHVTTPTILDNMIAAGQLPPLAVLFVGNINGRTRFRELFCHTSFVEFLAQELMPWAKREYNLRPDPQQTTVAGSSAGGMTAAFAALRRPDLFGNVLAQSGCFWWKPSQDEEFEWLTRQFVTNPQALVRFYLEVGLLESGPGLPTSSQSPAQIVANRHLRDVLQAKGYAVQYQEYHGGHEWVCWRGSLADGLMILYHR